MSSSVQSQVPSRQVYADEQKYHWLPILLDSYAICDDGTSHDLADHIKTRGQSVACHKGCSACCLNPMVPVSEIELRGISWYVSERLDVNTQDQLIPRLENQQTSTECPFLLSNDCSIYPMRPIACRIFHVFNKVCAPHEHVDRTRPKDIFVQGRQTARRVAMRFLDGDVYGLKSNEEKERAFEEGIMLKMATQMHEVNWKVLAFAINVVRQARGKQ